MRWMSATGSSEKSKPPPNAFTSTPSTSTSVKSDSPPRGKIDVIAPRPPDCVTVRPGTRRSASTTVSIWRAWRSARVMTVTLSGTSESGTSTCDADTTTDSSTAASRSGMSTARSSSFRAKRTSMGSPRKPGEATCSTYAPAGRPVSS